MKLLFDMNRQCIDRSTPCAAMGANRTRTARQGEIAHDRRCLDVQTGEHFLFGCNVLSKRLERKMGTFALLRQSFTKRSMQRRVGEESSDPGASLVGGGENSVEGLFQISLRR